MERRHLGGDIHALVSSELGERGFLVAFSERTGGVSTGKFFSLNLGLNTGDQEEAVAENRRLVARALGTGAIATLRQVHGNRVVELWERSDLAVTEGDALRTRRKGLPLAVMTADCVPLALASEEERTPAVAHLGWRGLAAGLLQRVGTFARPSSVTAAIGPSIGPCHYEVGEDVIAAVDSGTEGRAVVERLSGSLRLDLGATVEAGLRALGVPTVERAGECTACEPDRFFSYRRDGVTGRQALVAMRL